MVPSTPERPDLTRRFVLGLGGAAAAGLLGRSVAAAPADDPPPRRGKTVGIQVGSVSFVDEGVETVLDILQERGRVDTVYLTTFTYGRGLAGRQIPGQPYTVDFRTDRGRDRANIEGRIDGTAGIGHGKSRHVMPFVNRTTQENPIHAILLDDPIFRVQV